jgi:hypothetical protein
MVKEAALAHPSAGIVALAWIETPGLASVFITTTLQGLTCRGQLTDSRPAPLSWLTQKSWFSGAVVGALIPVVRYAGSWPRRSSVTWRTPCG